VNLKEGVIELSKLCLDLWKEDEYISVVARFEFSELHTGDFNFCLGNGFEIENIYDENGNITYNCMDKELEFRGTAQKIVVEKFKGNELTVEYKGGVNGYHNLNEEDILAVNFYSAWYPVESSVHLVISNVRVHLDDAFFVIKAKYNNQEKYWDYKPLDFDYNILAIKDYCVMKNEKVSVYYFGENTEQLAKPYFNNYSDIVDFYCVLYKSPEMAKNDIVILPKGNKYDGYKRKELIVFGGFREDYEGCIHLLAHEIAHNWCQGAKADSWEDWLNETTAEWSALLYEIEQKNEELVESVIQFKVDSCKDAPPIKTVDGSRPKAVHDKGVLLFYNMYKKYGVEVIRKLLYIFYNLEKKDTQNFIDAIHKVWPEVAEMITVGIME